MTDERQAGLREEIDAYIAAHQADFDAFVARHPALALAQVPAPRTYTQAEHDESERQLRDCYERLAQEPQCCPRKRLRDDYRDCSLPRRL